MDGKANLLDLALIILHNGCPPDNTMYLCLMDEEPEPRCEECWSRYLFWAANGYPEKRRPYQDVVLQED